MAVARVRIGSKASTGRIADPSVRAAVEEVWEGNGGRAFGATLYANRRWSRPSFTRWLGPGFDELPSDYHPYGRDGRLALFVAEQTGGTVEYPDVKHPPGTVFGTPGHVPLEDYRPLPEWLREPLEGPPQREQGERRPSKSRDDEDDNPGS